MGLSGMRARLTENDLLSWRAATLFARVALAAGFLSAVADRFGWWGPAGTGNVTWGTFEAFTDYVGDLAPYLPTSLLGLAAWGATIGEIVLGIALLLGVALRWTALASVAMLLVFAVSMFIFAGFETPFSASVFTAASAALLLALTPVNSHVLSVDLLLRSRSDLQRNEQPRP